MKYTHNYQCDSSFLYNVFRKNVVNYLILFLIINLFQLKTKKIFNNNKLIFGNKDYELEITYEMVGSEDVSSDYDVTIYSWKIL